MDLRFFNIAEFSSAPGDQRVPKYRILDEKIEFAACSKINTIAGGAGTQAAGLSCSARRVALSSAARRRATNHTVSSLAPRYSSLPMLLDFEVQRCTRRCAATDRSLEPGDVCYSVLEVQGADVVRRDFCAEAWSEAPESAFAWWKSRVPEPTTKKIKLAPNDVLLELFDQLAERPDQHDMRYVLALLLLRRRVLRLDVALEPPGAQSSPDLPDRSAESITVYCPKREANYEVPIVMPRGERIDEIQHQLSDLLVSGAE